MVLDHRYHQLDQVRGYLSQAIYPIQWTIDAPFRIKNFICEFAQTHYRLVKENQTIKEQQLMQEGRLQRLFSLEAENKYLRALLQASPKKGDILKGAEIIQVDPDPFNHRIFLNKGKKDGVFIGQPIIDAKGVIGEVIEVFDSNSRALLVTDASHAVPVENLRNGVRGILVGVGALDSLQLQYVPTTADIQVGDILMTSGLGGRFPAGYPVAVVIDVSKDAGESFAVIRAVPKADLDRGRQVLLVQNNSDSNDEIEKDREYGEYRDEHKEQYKEQNKEQYSVQAMENIEERIKELPMEKTQGQSREQIAEKDKEQDNINNADKTSMQAHKAKQTDQTKKKFKKLHENQLQETQNLQVEQKPQETRVLEETVNTIKSKIGEAFGTKALGNKTSDTKKTSIENRSKKEAKR